MDDYKIIVEQENQTVMAHYDVETLVVAESHHPCLHKER